MAQTILCLGLNENQIAWLEAELGYKPTSKALKKWLMAGNSLAEMPSDKRKGPEKGFRTKRLTTPRE